MTGKEDDWEAYMRGMREAHEYLDGLEALDAAAESACSPDPWDESDEDWLTGPDRCNCGECSGDRGARRKFPIPPQAVVAAARNRLEAALPPPARCAGCGIEDCSPIGAGPFEDGLCRYCAQLNAYEPVALTTARESYLADRVPMRPEGIVSARTALRYVIYGDDRARRARLAVMMTAALLGSLLWIIAIAGLLWSTVI